jgi:geranylgeranyl pyrophosphate synthase
MVGGQLRDLDAEGQQVTLADLETIHRGKTGSLIAAAVAVGGEAARATAAQVAALESFGDHVGLAFQIADDILDVTATTEALGKVARRDLDLAKSTYPGLLGLDGASARAEEHITLACGELERAGVVAPLLEALAHFAVRRTS